MKSKNSRISMARKDKKKNRHYKVKGKNEANEKIEIVLIHTTEATQLTTITVSRDLFRNGILKKLICRVRDS